jgi:hypothetical protein
MLSKDQNKRCLSFSCQHINTTSKRKSSKKKNYNNSNTTFKKVNRIQARTVFKLATGNCLLVTVKAPYN